MKLIQYILMASALCVWHADLLAQNSSNTLHWIGQDGFWHDPANWSTHPQGPPAFALPDAHTSAQVAGAHQIFVQEPAQCAALYAGTTTSFVLADHLTLSGDLYASTSTWQDLGGKIIFDTPTTKRLSVSSTMGVDILATAGKIVLDQNLMFDFEHGLQAREATIDLNEKFLFAASLRADANSFLAFDKAQLFINNTLDISNAVRTEQDKMYLLVSPTMEVYNPGPLDIASANTNREVMTCVGTDGEILSFETIITTDYNGQDVSCNGACDANLDVTIFHPNPETYTIQWIPGGGSTCNIPPNNVRAGTYLVIVTSPSGLSCAQSIVVNEPAALGLFQFVLNEPTCSGICNGSGIPIVVGGTGNLDYAWNPSANPPGPTVAANFALCEGQNQLVVQDVNACVFDTIFQIDVQQIDINLTATDVTCFGGSNGAATSAPSGGAGGPFVFSWTGIDPNPGDTDTANNLPAGTYTLSVSDIEMCTVDTTFTITEPPEIVITQNGLIPVTCFGDSDGAIDISVAGGTLDTDAGNEYEFDWMGPSVVDATLEDQDNLLAGEYTLTVTDDNNCTANFSAEVLSPDSITVLADLTMVDCFDKTTGAIDLTLSGGTGNFVVSWTGPDMFSSSAPDINDLAAGQYCVNISDANNCMKSLCFDITEPDELLGNTVKTDISCNGLTDGTIMLMPSGGTPEYIYTWTGTGIVQGQQNQENLGAGTYTLLITDENGCTYQETVEIIEPLALSVVGIASQIDCSGDDDGTVDITASGGTGDYTYAWTGPNNYTNDIEDIDGLAPGDYTVEITDERLCTTNGTFSVVEIDAIDVAETQVNVQCAGDNSGSISLVVSGGTPNFVFLWAGPSITALNENNQNQSNLLAGTYDVIVADNNLCTANFSYEITEPLPLELGAVSENPNCFNTTDGSITLNPTGGTLDYTFAWTGPGVVVGDQDQVDLAPGTYTVVLTDANMCPISETFVLEAPDAIVSSLSASPISCNGDNDGSIVGMVTGGVGILTFDWIGPDGLPLADETANPDNLSAGLYNLTISDENGCMLTGSFDVLEPEAIAVAGVIEDVSCGNASDGGVDVTISGGTPDYDVEWTNEDGEVVPAVNNDINNVPQGVYTINILDDQNCAFTTTFEVGGRPPIEINSNQSDTICFGATNGNIDLTLTGGLPDFTVLWTGLPAGNNPAEEDQENLPPGEYSVLVTDAENCTAMAEFSITAFTEIMATATVQNPLCAGDETGSILLEITGGAPDYTAVWNGNLVQEDLIEIGEGIYTLVVTDARGCTQNSILLDGATVTEIEVEAPAPIVISETHTNPICFDDLTGTIDLTVDGGVGDYTYTWTNTAGTDLPSTEDLAGLFPDTYTVVVVDENMCTNTIDITIEAPEEIILTEVITDILCAGEVGFIDISFSGGSGNFDPPVWSSTAGFILVNEDIQFTQSGDYTISITDDAGCNVERIYTIEVQEAIVVNETITNLGCAGQGNGAISLDVSGGTGALTLEWTLPGGGTTDVEDLIDLDAGDYILTVTDENDCVFNATYTVQSPAEIMVDIVANDPQCASQNSGSISIVVTGGSGVYPIISWTGPDGFIADGSNLSQLFEGEYVLHIEDNGSCIFDTTILLEDPSQIEFAATETDISCFGLDGGAIALEVMGGNPEYTFAWTGPEDFTADTEDITDLAPGDYSVNIMDANNCPVVGNFTLENATEIIVDISTIKPTCTLNNGQIVASVEGGEEPYVIEWIDSNDIILITNDTLTMAGAGNYTMRLIDGNGCEILQNVPLSNEDGPQIALDATAVDCYENSTGAIDATITEGTEPYSFSWTGPDNYTNANEDIADLPAGEYVLTVEDNVLCVVVESIIVTQPDSISIVAVGTEVACFGENNGRIDIDVTGGTGDYTFEWTGPNMYTSNAEDIDDLFAGEYCVLVTDANGCTNSICFPLMELDELSIDTDVRQIICFGDQDGYIDITPTGGTEPYTYSWTGDIIADTEDLTDLGPGTYNLEVSDANGCGNMLTFELTENPLLSHALTATLPGCGLADGEIVAEVTGGAVAADYTYSWVLVEGATETEVGTTATLQDAAAGIYNFNATDDAGCTTSETYLLNSSTTGTISEVVIDTQCFDSSEGAINITVAGMTDPLVFQWIGPNDFLADTEDIAMLMQGDYTISVEDGNNCVLSQTISVGGPIALELTETLTHLDCFGANTGSISLSTLGGTPNFDFSWTGPNDYTGSGVAINGLAAGCYDLVASDQNACTTTAQYCLTEPEELLATITKNDVICAGDETGSILTVISGGTPDYTIEWQDANGPIVDATENLNMIGGGLYTLTVTDLNLCTTTVEAFIDEQDSIAVQREFVLPTCLGDMDGQINLVLSGGELDYDVQWPDLGLAGETIIDLEAGIYNFNIVDGLGCTKDGIAELLNPDTLKFNAVVMDVSCFGDTNGSIESFPSGGDPDYIFSWTGPNDFVSENQNLDALESGTYIGTITDQNNCTRMETLEVEMPALLTASLTTQNNVSCPGDVNGSIMILPEGGTPEYIFSWTDGAGFMADTQDISDLQEGTYTLNLMDNLGCTFALDPITITFDDFAEAIAPDDLFACPDLGLYTLEGTGQNIVSQTWTNLAGEELGTESILNQELDMPGAYSYIYTVNSEFCTAEDTVLLTLWEPPFVDAGQEQTIFISSEVTIGGNPTTDDDNTVVWSPSEWLTDTLAFNPLTVEIIENVTFFATVTDANGCTNMDSVVVTLFPELGLSSGFTPNGDGINDTWGIGNTGQYPSLVLHIFNRWGSEVYEQKGSFTPWDGRLNGTDLPVGTYYFFIEIDEPDFKAKIDGPVTLVR